jgi:methylase of polypeptide subunit release factors
LQALDDDALVELRAALDEGDYKTERIERTLGGGRISFTAADVEVHARRLPAGEPFSTLASLFLLGLPVREDSLDERVRALERPGLLERDNGAVRAAVKIVPHGDVLVASDPEAGPTGPDWVAGIHPPSVTLAKLTVRRRVARALDVATGNGIQALLAARHADAVVATDINPRALAFASLNARLNGVGNVDLRLGDLFETAAGEHFDLVTCNPPYVISPEAQYAYRDSGLTGDTVSRRVVEAAPAHLVEGGFAHVLVSWAHPAGDPWAPLERWVEGSGCDSWLLYFGSDDPVTHAAEWLRPVAQDDLERYRASLTAWLDYLQRLGIEAIAHGAVILRRRSGRNWTRKDRIELDRLEQASDHVLRVFASQDVLERLPDNALLGARFTVVGRHHLDQRFGRRDGQVRLESTSLSLEEGFRFRIALDEHTARLLPLLDGRRTLREALVALGHERELPSDDAARFIEAALPAARRLVELGFVVPV